MRDAKCMVIGPLALPCAYCNGACIALGVKELNLRLQHVYSATCTPGTSLFMQGTVAGHVFAIRRGLVKLVEYLANGTPRIVRLLKEGDIAGLEGLVDGNYRATAVAINNVHACIIPIQEVRRWDGADPRFHQLLLQRWQTYLDQADNIITQLSTGTAQARMARLLLSLLAHQEAGDRCRCDALPREDMGALLGLTTETASRIIAMFKRQGLVGYEMNQCFSCNPIELKRLAEG